VGLPTASAIRVVGPTNVTLDGLRRVSMNLRDETSPLEAAAKPLGVLQAASRWSVTGYDLGDPTVPSFRRQ
jgi:hypothetical protein